MLTTPRRDSMRRIALAAALAATLAGGAAALAATPDPAGTDATPPDPYQGAWQLNLDGCDLVGQVAAAADGGHKHVTAVKPEPCSFDAGAGMSPAFTDWVNGALQNHPAVHDAQLVRSDARPGYALELPRAFVTGVTLPRVERAATAPVYLRVSLSGDSVRRIATTAPPLARLRPLVPTSLAVTVAGQGVNAASVGPWTAT